MKGNPYIALILSTYLIPLAGLKLQRKDRRDVKVPLSTYLIPLAGLKPLHVIPGKFDKDLSTYLIPLAGLKRFYLAGRSLPKTTFQLT